MIELANIDVSFKSELQDKIFTQKRQQVLYDINFSVEEGSCLGILGESGSGKSTIGRVLCGLLKPDSGQLLLNGINVYGNKKGKRLLQQHISVVFQDYTTSANPRFSVKEIVAEGLNIYQRKSAQKVDMDKEITELLEQVGLDRSFETRYPHQLSGGQLQRVCIARAIACRPKLILLDEAISALDAHTQVQIMDLLRDLKEIHKLTYVFITHDLTAITYLCDKVLFLCDGHITTQCNVGDIGKIRDEYARKLLESIMDFQN